MTSGLPCFSARCGADLNGTMILISRGSDNGATWTNRAPRNSNAGVHSGGDRLPQLARDRAGNWLAVRSSFDDLGGLIGTVEDILFSRSSSSGRGCDAGRSFRRRRSGAKRGARMPRRRERSGETASRLGDARSDSEVLMLRRACHRLSTVAYHTGSHMM